MINERYANRRFCKIKLYKSVEISRFLKIDPTIDVFSCGDSARIPARKSRDDTPVTPH